MADLSPIMKLFREWETKFADAGDMVKTTDEQSEALLDRCRVIEHQMLSMPAVSAPEFAAKLISSTSYGGFSVDENGPLIAEARALVAKNVQHSDAELLTLAAERNRLVELRTPIREKANRLSALAEEQWKSEGNGASRDDPAVWEAYMDLCHRVGLIDAEDARDAIDDQIFPLDHKIRAIPAQTVAGLKVKFDLLRDYMPTSYDDEGSREDQDLDVCLFNELDDEFARLAQAETPDARDFKAVGARFVKARAEQEQAVQNGDEEGPAWDEYEAAEGAVIKFPCRTIEEVREKARFFLENDGPYDTIRNCFSNEGETLRPFLQSLLGGAS
jgi:hypothetical protein